MEPNVNRRAQEIIAANMHAHGGATSGSAAASALACDAVPVLEQLDSTAPRTARTHDISHLCDAAGVLAPGTGGSLIDEADHVFESTFLPAGPLSVYDDRDGLWHTRVFPSATPSSRADAVHLDEWIGKALARQKVGASAGGQGLAEDLGATAGSVVPILSVAMREVVRQVGHHCAERGVALDKIWLVYVELFRKVLSQMQDTLRQQRRDTSELQSELANAREELISLKKAHPTDLHRAISDLERVYNEQQSMYEAALSKAREENELLEDHSRTQRREIDLWYPGFDKYKESYIKHHVPDMEHLHGGARAHRAHASEPGCAATHMGQQDGDDSPEVAIAKDFKRLLAVLAPDKRKAIGEEVRATMESVQPGGQRGRPEHRRSDRKRSVAPGCGPPLPAGSEKERFAALKVEVKAQDETIYRLRAEIACAEAEQSAAGAKSLEFVPKASVVEDESAGDVLFGAVGADQQSNLQSRVAVVGMNLSRRDMLPDDSVR